MKIDDLHAAKGGFWFKELFIYFGAVHSFCLFCNFSYDTFTLFFLGMFSCWVFFLPELCI
jgi:hypothetical protein